MAKVNKLGKEKTALQQEVNGLRRNAGQRDWLNRGGPSGNTQETSGRGNAQTTNGTQGPRNCRICKLPSYSTKNCLELPANASKRPTGWKSVL